MTDNEIIKALEYCDRTGNCCGCPYGRCIEVDINELALSLINRQKAEIERLQKHIQEGIDLAKQIPEMVSLAQAEAIKEFAEGLKENIRMNGFCEKFVFESDIDNLVKEMVGDGNGC